MVSLELICRPAAHFSRGRTAAFCLVAASIASACSSAAAFASEAGVRIELRERGGRQAVVATGFDAQNVLDRVADWRHAFRVQVASQDDTRPPAMLGDYALVDGELWFTPRFPLRPGLAYHATLDLEDGAEPLATTTFKIPAPSPLPPARVLAVYPSADQLPENLLKLYLHFSAPVRQGTLFRHVAIADAAGRVVERPFVEIDQELWDRSGTRLTLLFDPGRIKRGLVPREQFGPIFEEGKTYTLTIDADWRDALDRPLAESYQRNFRIVAPDEQQPKLSDWQVEPPIAGSRAPLRVVLDEALDHAMLQRVLNVATNAGEIVPGEVVTALAETVWLFTPDAPWAAGEYQLVVDDDLEDLAGNSLGRPFEVDVFDRVDDGPIDRTVSVDFEVH